MEIERKFLVAGEPDSEPADAVEIEQGYLALDAGSGVEVRLRRRGEERFLTVKGGEGRSRTEEEVALSARQFDSLWPLTAGRRVRKTRQLIAASDLEFELDVYEDELDGLRTVEVEFPDESRADSFEPPEWFGEEVTGDRGYLNQTLATEGAPR